MPRTDPVEEILAYVERRNGARWIDLEREFVGRRRWSKGRFVNHFKEAKKYLEKVYFQDIKAYKYVTKADAKILAEKSIFKINIEEGEMHEIIIDKSRLTPVIQEIAKQFYYDHFPYFWQVLTETGFSEEQKQKESLVKRILGGKQTPITIEEFVARAGTSHIFSELCVKWAEFVLESLAEKMRIIILCPQGETPPELSDEDIRNIFLITCFKFLDKNKGTPRKAPFHIIISFPTSEVDLQSLMRNREEFSKFLTDTIVRFIQHVKS